MKSRDERLLAIIAQAAPPDDRIAGVWLTPVEHQNGARLERLMAQWRSAFGPEVDAERAVASVRVTGELPCWAAAFLELVSEDDFFAPARRFIETTHAAATARQDLLRLFVSRVNGIVSPLFEYEKQLAAAAAALGPSDLGNDWTGRFERFPVLAYLLGMALTQWRVSVKEMFERVAVDLPECGRVVSFTGDAGDVHGGGRAVALLTFENGERIAYKPKDLRCAAAFNDLIAFLEPSLRTRRILVRDGYGLEEFVSHRPCANAQEVAIFYRRFGMLVRLLQLVEARDFWLDNLVAEGAQPVFIDLETILQPRVRPEGLAAAEVAARERLAETVVESCTIAMGTPIDVGVSAEDLGALAPPRAYLTPFQHDGKFLTWSHQGHAPMLEGVAANPAEHLEALIEGYRHMHARIVAMRDALLQSGSPLLRLGDAPVRFIRRDTWTYYKVLRRSYAPALLVNGVQREIALRKMLGQADNPEAERELTLAEVAALRQMDVPLFLSLPRTNAVRTPLQTTVENYFDGAAWSRLEHRLAAIERFPLQEEIEILLGCFSTVYPTKRRTPQRNQRWLEQAARLGDAILGDVIERDGELGAIGIAYHPHIDLLNVEVLHPELLTGTCGLALFFAELFGVTGEARFEAAAREAIGPTIRAMRRSAAQWSGVRGANGPLYCGALLGTGAYLFTLRVCARLLREPTLESMADDHACAIPVDTLLNRCGTDFVAGTTGLLLALGHAPALAAALGRRRPFSVPPFPQKRRGLDGTPDATAAFALACSRMGLEFEPFELHSIGNIRAALEIDRFSGMAVDCARAIEDLDLALDVYELTDDPRDRDRAMQLATTAPEPSRYDLSPFRGRVGLGRAFLCLGGARIASIATLRSTTFTPLS